MNKLVAINAIHYFIGSALVLVLPLLLLAQGMDIAVIGGIFAVLPLVGLVARVVFAALADQAGERPFFLLNWAANSGLIAVYLTGTNPVAFAFGKLLEGVKESSFWAVVRTATFKNSGKGQQGRQSAFFTGVRALATAVGTFSAGVLIVNFSFTGTLYFLFLVSLLLLPFSLGLEKAKAKWSARKTRELIFRKRSRSFWKASAALSLYAVTSTALYSFILPIFMRKELGMSYESIGLTFAAYYLLYSLATFAAVRLNLSLEKAGILSGLFFAPAAAFLWVPSAFLPLLGFLAIGDGLSALVFEGIVAKETVGKPGVSTAIGVIHMPFRFAEFATALAAGVAAQAYGYFPVFVVSALAFAAYIYFSVRSFKNQKILPALRLVPFRENKH